MTKNKKPKKSLIFLKASVLAFGLVFLVLLVLLVFMKLNQNNQIKQEVVSCKLQKEVTVPNQVDQLIESRKDIIILTKPKNGSQDLLTLDKKCGLIKGRIKLTIK
jgi:hypothetical protein